MDTMEPAGIGGLHRVVGVVGSALVPVGSIEASGGDDRVGRGASRRLGGEDEKREGQQAEEEASEPSAHDVVSFRGSVRDVVWGRQAGRLAGLGPRYS